jgi:tRNA (guanine-N7-)-methyltransferase
MRDVRNRDVQDPSEEVSSPGGAPGTRLAIDHPQYRYPSSRNPYWAKLQAFQGKVFSDNETEAHAGRWREHFPDVARARSGDRKLHVEIGCNAGHVILEWAARDPSGAYVGLDWKFKPIFRGAEKAQKRGLSNLLFFRSHAERLRFMFAPGEIDFLYLFFPDPWPKKSQRKNRFVTAERLRAIAPVLKPGGIFHIKTDHPGYFEWMEKALEEAKDAWRVVERTRDLHQGHPDPLSLQIPDVTLFERLFVRDGIPIQSLKLQRA